MQFQDEHALENETLDREENDYISIREENQVESSRVCETVANSSSQNNDLIQKNRATSVRTRQRFFPIDPRPLDNYIRDLETMTINDLTSKPVEPIAEISERMAEWFTTTGECAMTLKFDIDADVKTVPPRDLLLVEWREKDDLYDSYIGAYQHLLRYNRDIIDRDSAPIGTIARQLSWYSKACNLILQNPALLDTVTIDYSYTITSSLNSAKYTGATKFLLFYHPVGLFDTNNMLPTQVWNRLIFRYRFLDKPFMLIPSITRSFSNSDEFATLVNSEFNRILLCVASFSEHSADITDGGVDEYTVRSELVHGSETFSAVFRVTGRTIQIMDYRLLPTVETLNSYYTESPSPIVVDVKKYKEILESLNSKYGALLPSYGYRESLFNDALISIYKPNNFNVAIVWWFLNGSSDYSSANLLVPVRDVIDRVFNPCCEHEKLYHLSKIRIVAEKKMTVAQERTRETPKTSMYTFNELIHVIHTYVMKKSDHYYFKHQRYEDISSDAKAQKRKPDDNQHDEPSRIAPIDAMVLKFVWNGNVYKTTFEQLDRDGYLTLDTLFSLERTISVRPFYDYDEIVNYLYYIHGILQNRTQNMATLLRTVSTLLGSYSNDMRTLYIIGESQCGKSVFKNILLQYIAEYYEKTSTRPSDFNYDDSSVLKVYDDVDLIEKTNKQRTYLILNKDSLTVNINEKNKQPVRVYKDITNLVLNNDWPLVTTWYHQRRVKTCMFVPNSRNSLQYTVERIFKNETRGNGSFNDVFINNFFQYVVTFRDAIHYDGVYYSDCRRLLDNDLPYEIIAENTKNILGLSTVRAASQFIGVFDNKCIAILKQRRITTHTDYYALRRFTVYL